MDLLKSNSKADESLQMGQTVEVVNQAGEFLCYGLYSPNSQIRVRALSFDENVKSRMLLLHQE